MILILIIFCIIFLLWCLTGFQMQFIITAIAIIGIAIVGYITLLFITSLRNKERHYTTCKHDPIEDDEKIKNIIDLADQEANEILEKQGIPMATGYCHRLWKLKKKILKEKYNIDWKTPQEMNPGWRFD